MSISSTDHGMFRQVLWFADQMHYWCCQDSTEREIEYVKSATNLRFLQMAGSCPLKLEFVEGKMSNDTGLLVHSGF